MNEMFSHDALLEHWEGHRRLTLRVLEAFPKEKLFSYAPTEALRPFGKMMAEIINVEMCLVDTLLAGAWQFGQPPEYSSKEALLEASHEVREKTRVNWRDLKPERLLDIGPVPLPTPLPPLADFLYAFENEIHHRAQGYVYLRLLGVEPPAFFER